jgi:hypothetical protein
MLLRSVRNNGFALNEYILLLQTSNDQLNIDNMNKINSKIKEIVKSIHNNLSEDKPNEKDNINRFKEK